MDSALLNLLGAAALLLWSIRMVRTGVSRAFGARLRLWLAKATRNRASAFLFGLGATCALQSSTATALLTASFASRALISLPMGLAIMLGADLGTSLVAYVLAFDVGWLSPILILLGVVIFLANRASRPRAIGRALLGLGLLLLCLKLISSAATPLAGSATVQNLLPALAQAPAVGMAIAAGLAFLSSSSLAVVLLTMSLAGTGTIPPGLALAMVLGLNLGGALVPVVAMSREGAVGRRVPWGNLLFKCLGCAVVLPFLETVSEFTGAFAAGPAGSVVLAHVAFNGMLAVLALPLVGLSARLLQRLLPDAEDPETGPLHLDEAALQTPTIALACAARETMRIGDRIEKMLGLSLSALTSEDRRACADIRELDDEVDTLQEAVKLYVSRLRRDACLSGEDDRRSSEILLYAVNLEHVGDIIDKSLRGLLEKKIRNRLSLSPEGMAEIQDLCQQTMRNLRAAQSVFSERDQKLAQRLVDLKVDVRRVERRSTENHLERVRQGNAESIQSGTIHLDVLRDLKRINAHLASVAYPMLEASGLLRESRLVVPQGQEAAAS